MFGRNAPAAECPLPTIIEEMEEMFLRLGFSKLMEDQEIDYPWTPASLSDVDIPVFEI